MWANRLANRVIGFATTVSLNYKVISVMQHRIKCKCIYNANATHLRAFSVRVLRASVRSAPSPREAPSDCDVLSAFLWNGGARVFGAAVGK